MKTFHARFGIGDEVVMMSKVKEFATRGDRYYPEKRVISGVVIMGDGVQYHHNGYSSTFKEGECIPIADVTRVALEYLSACINNVTSYEKRIINQLERSGLSWSRVQPPPGMEGAGFRVSVTEDRIASIVGDDSTDLISIGLMDKTGSWLIPPVKSKRVDLIETLKNMATFIPMKTEDDADEEGPLEGDHCPECDEGLLEYQSVENCSCHISPPCNACVTNPLRCPLCGWKEDV